MLDIGVINEQFEVLRRAGIVYRLDLDLMVTRYGRAVIEVFIGINRIVPRLIIILRGHQHPVFVKIDLVVLVVDVSAGVTIYIHAPVVPDQANLHALVEIEINGLTGIDARPNVNARAIVVEVPCPVLLRAVTCGVDPYDSMSARIIDLLRPPAATIVRPPIGASGMADDIHTFSDQVIDSVEKIRLATGTDQIQIGSGYHIIHDLGALCTMVGCCRTIGKRIVTKRRRGQCAGQLAGRLPVGVVIEIAIQDCDLHAAAVKTSAMP